MHLRTMQLEARAWRAKNFPEDTETMTVNCTLGVAEEVGELCHSILKHRQGIRGDRDHHVTEAKDAVGDIVIFLSGVCDGLGIDLQAAVMDAWAQVKQRDWIQDPESGGQ